MPSVYNTVFGGNPVAPAIPTYLALSFSVNTTLGWPLESNITAPAVAEWIDCTATAGGLALQLSDARQVSTGYTAIFNNVGANTFTILDAQGNTLMAPASGAAWILVLSDNSTLQGTWRALQLGTGTSVANAAALAGAGLKAITTTLNERIFINAQATNYTIQNTDRASCVEWTGGSGGTFTAPAPATVGTDWFCYIKNSGTGVLTLSPAAGNIDGTSNKSFNPNDSCVLISDGANLFTLGFGQSVASSFNFVTISLAGASGTVILGGAQLNRISYKFTGALAGNVVVQVPASIQQYWVDNETTGAFTLTISAGGAGSTFVVPQASRVILYCDGLNIVNAVTSGTGSTVLVADGSAAAPGLAWASDTQMGLYKAGVDILGFSTAGTARGTIGSSGNWAIAAPTSGAALTVAGISGSQAIFATGPTSGTNIVGIFGSSDSAYQIYLQNDIAGSSNYLGSSGTSARAFGIKLGNTVSTTWSAVGNVTINAPSSGTTLAVTGGAVARPVQFIGSSTSGQSYGPLITAGTTSGDQAILVQNQAASVSFFEIFGDGHGFLGPTGALGLSWNTAGDITIAAPSSGIPLSVNGTYAGGVVPGIASVSAGGTGNFISSYDGTHETLFGTYASGGFVGSFSNHLFDIRTNNTQRVSVSAAGSITVNAPSSGPSLLVNVINAVQGFQLAAPASASTLSTGWNVGWVANAWNMFSQSTDPLAIGTLSTQPLTFGTNSTNRVVISSSGNVAVNAAAGSVNSLTSTGNSGGGFAGAFNGAISAGNSNGVVINAGTNSSDIALLVRNDTAATTYFEVRGDGVVFGNDGTNLFELGYKDTPQNVQTVSYQLVLADRGKSIVMNGSNLTLTIPANASVAFPVGTTIAGVNKNATALTVAITTDTLVLAGTATTGSRTVVTNGLFTLYKDLSTEWIISGSGVS